MESVLQLLGAAPEAAGVADAGGRLPLHIAIANKWVRQPLWAAQLSYQLSYQLSLSRHMLSPSSPAA